MANEKEEVVLDLKIDAGAAEKDLVKIEKSILGTKAAMQDLSKAYKAGQITTEEFIEENIRLQSVQKKEQEQKRTLIQTLNTESNSRNAIKLRISQLTKEYDNLNRSTATGAKRADELEKELKQLNEQITKTSKSAGLFKDQIGNYPQNFDDAKGSITEFSKTLFKSEGGYMKFAAGAGIAAAAATTLFKVYTESASGARDLEAAQIRLSFATQIAGEKIADFLKVEDSSIGFLEGATIALLSRYIPAIYAESEAYATVAKTLKDLEISRAFAAGDAKNDERRAEVLRRIRDDESKLIDDRIAASAQIDAILENSAKRTIIILQAEADAIRRSTVNYDLNREAQLKVAQLTAEIADKEEEITGKLTENVTSRRALIKLRQDELFLLEQEIREANKPGGNLTAQSPGGDQLADPAIQASKERIDQFARELQAVEFTEKQKQEYYRRSATIKMELDQIQQETYLNSLGTTLGAAASLFDQQSSEYKIIASAQALIATYSSATKAYDALAAIPYVGPALGAAAAAAAIAAGLANVAQINGVQFAQGGYTGPGFGSPDSSGFKPAGIVHEHEYVAPKRVVMMPQAQHHINALESMRTRGYADGGLVTSSAVSAADQAVITANAIKMLPTPEVSVKEITKAQARIRVRENVATLSR
jgi:hypothetical protein